MMPRPTISQALLRPYGPRPISSYRSSPTIPIRIGHKTEMVDRQLLHAYLPNMSTMYRSLHSPIDLTNLIQNNTFRSARIQPHMLLETLSELISSLANDPQDFHTTNLDLQTWLEASLYSPQWQHPHCHLFETTYQYFSSLAYLADRFDSPRLRKTVVHFFTHHGSTIAQRERDPLALFDWAHSIYKCIRNQEDLIECFRQIVMARPDFGVQMNRIVKRNPTPSTRMICRGINQIVERVEESDIQLLRQGRGNFRRGTGMALMRGGISPLGRNRGRRPVIGRSLSGALVPRGVVGVPIKAVVKMEKRRVDMIEDRLVQLEGGVQDLAEHTVAREVGGTGEDPYDDLSGWDDSDYEDSDSVWGR